MQYDLQSFMQKARNIWIFGPVNMDVMVRPVDPGMLFAGSAPVEDIGIFFGGDALNEAVILHRLGASVSLVSEIGQDAAGDQLAGFLEQEGISAGGIVRREGVATSINIVMVDSAGERYFLTNPHGSMRQITGETYMARLDDAGDLVCFPGMFVSPRMDIPAMERIFRAAKARPGRILAADMTRAKNGETLADLRNVLPLVDYLFPNEEEIAVLTGEKDPEVNARLLTEAGVGCAVIKRGAKGCLIATKDRRIPVPAWPLGRATDTTGAGDSFVAGFLYALAGGMDLADCGRFANAVASCIAETFGANAGLRSPEAALERFRQMV